MRVDETKYIELVRHEAHEINNTQKQQLHQVMDIVVKVSYNEAKK